MTKLAAVLGAGIQGCCAALALSQLGFRVRLYDKNRMIFNRASANQEGKIHLGFVYARDQSMVTPRKMIEHAMQFAPALESLIGGAINWEPHLSTRFYCGIHKDSSLTIDEHYAHFDALQKIYEEVSSDSALHYLGRRPKRIWTNESSFRFGGDSMTDAIQSEETAVHPGWMRQVIVDAIERDPNINVYAGHRIDHVEKNHQSIIVSGMCKEESWERRVDIVVNCLWEGKQKIDRAFNTNRDHESITRIKYGFVLDSTEALSQMPSLIITHGPFGDIVNYPLDNTIYITWYPACLAYIAHTDILPDAWEEVIEGNHPPALSSFILSESLRMLSEYLPELKSLKLRQVMAGSIMGHGKTDISDKESGLHRRHGIGVDAHDDYYSIFTGKYTSGPANAMELQRLIA